MTLHRIVLSTGLLVAGAWLAGGRDVGPVPLQQWHAGILLVCAAVPWLPVSRTRRSLMWAALLVAGLVSMARVLITPPFAVYPTYAVPSDLVHGQRAAALVLGIQALLVLTRGAPSVGGVPGVLGWCGRHPWRALLAIAFTGASVAIPTRSLGFAAVQWGVGMALTLMGVANAWLLAQAVASEEVPAWLAWIRRRVSAPGEPGTRGWDGGLPWVIAGVVTVAASVVSVWVFEGMPHIDDSVSYLFHARYLAQGVMSVPAPPDSAAFGVDETLIDGGRWFGYGFPGWPAALSLAVRVGMPWLANPVLAGLLVLGTHAAVRATHDRGNAHLAAPAMACSPWLLFMSGEFMPHPLAAWCTMAALLSALRLRAGGGSAWGLAGGVSLGLLALVRPLDAALAAGLVTVVLLVPRQGARPLAVGGMGAIAAAVAALIVPYNRFLTGRGSYTPQMLWTDRRWGPGADRIGFGADIGIREWSNIDPLPGHSLVDVVLNLNRNAFVTQTDLFGWGAASLLLVTVAVVTLRRPVQDKVWWALVASFVAGYCFYWFSGGPDLGARYWYPALPGLAVLSVRGGLALAGQWAHPRAGTAILVTCAVASLGAWAAVIPARAVTKYHGYRLIGDEVAELVEEEGIRGGLVLIRSPQRARYQAAFHLNSVPPGEGNVFAREAGAASRAAVVRAFPGRPVWLVEADSVSRALRVVERPSARPGNAP